MVACESFKGLHRLNNVLLSITKSIVDMLQMCAHISAPAVKARNSTAEYW